MTNQMLDLNNRMVELNNRMLNANQQLLELGTKSFDDNATVKVVTILTLIYLPASLVSVSIPRPPEWSLFSPFNSLFLE
ncbi:MAG: hypothetical protein LBE67_19085 [Kocuria palustris]|nr:hypothetical protein [Kocuria palustris]